MTSGARPLAADRSDAPAPGPAGEGSFRSRGRWDPRRATFRLLVAPPAVALAAFLVVPLLFMAALSVRKDLSGSLMAPFTPTLSHYQAFFASAGYLRLLQTSAFTALGVASIATAAAYPVAYFLRFRAGRRAGLYLVLLLVPFWTSYLLRVMAWKLMLGEAGVVNSLLIASGAISAPLDALLYNRGAVVVTLVYVWIPFATLPILASLGRIDPRLHDAAADLYAGPFTQFLRVTLPLSLPGVVASFLMVFIPTVGEYVTPLLVGGTTGTLYGNIIQDLIVRAANWPLGAALSVVMLVATLALVAAGLRAVDPRRLVTQ